MFFVTLMVYVYETYVKSLCHQLRVSCFSIDRGRVGVVIVPYCIFYLSAIIHIYVFAEIVLQRVPIVTITFVVLRTRVACVKVYLNVIVSVQLTIL